MKVGSTRCVSFRNYILIIKLHTNRLVPLNEIDGFNITAIFKSEKLLKELNENWEKVFPLTLEYVHESESRKKEISAKVREFYFDNQPISEANMKNLSNVS